jgi:type IV pilus assembly protein PilB
MHISEARLRDLLLKSDLVTDEVFDSAKEESMRLSQTITDVLIGRKDISEKHLAELLEPYFGVPYVDLKGEVIPDDVLEMVPEIYAKTKQLVMFAFDKETRTGKIAMLDPLDYEAIEFLRAKFGGVWLDTYLTTPTSLHFGLKQYKKKVGVEFTEIINENVKQSLSATGQVDIAKMVEMVPIITIMDSIIEHAAVLNASDIHFEPLVKDVLVRYRIDGILHEILALPKAIEPILVARVKVMAGLQIDEHKVPQDGRFRFEMDEGSKVDLRVNVMPVFHGEKVEMRLLKSSMRPLSLSELGFSSEVAKLIREDIKKPHGMVLVTGPTGHGKTTTLYAILHLLNTPEVNITTIEDPIEYEVQRINQTQVNMKAGITFANGLRALLRQNPDIIMIGEIRDAETVDIAVHAALTGHLVLSSLHTNDATSAIPRLLDMGAPAFLLSSTINMVIAQRLVRKICTSCIESYTISSEVSRLIGAQIALSGDAHIKNIPKTLYRGKGCKVCGGAGFTGQIGIFEVFRVTDKIRELILKQASASEIRKTAVKEGMEVMFEDGLSKVERGITTIEEVLRVVRE